MNRDFVLGALFGAAWMALYVAPPVALFLGIALLAVAMTPPETEAEKIVRDR
jgi:hypothetical protein